MKNKILRAAAALLQPFTTTAGQAGAMFGMDARVALIVTAVVASAGGVTLMSRVERGKVDEAQRSAEALREGMLKYYRNVSINTLPDSLEALFATTTVTEPQLRRDPWGNPWFYEHIAANVRVENTPITLHYAIIYSAGKDGVPNSPSLQTEMDYAQWEPLGDDVGIKLSTRDIEMGRLEEYRARALLIVDKLSTAENVNYLEAQASCEGSTPPGWCESGSEGQTDGGTNRKNYSQFNFYPPSNLDSVEDAISYARDIVKKTVYNSGSEADMQQLMTDIGLPPSYARDPWGRLLQYNSNVSQRSDPPFSTAICFSFGENCFNTDTR